MNSTPPLHNELPWWKERMVWLIIALPLSAVLAGIATVLIASHDPDAMVNTEYVKEGMTVSAPRSALDKAASMGLSGTVSYSTGVLTLQLAGQSALPQTLELALVHPTQAKLDQQIPLTVIGQGTYQAQIDLTGQGKRQLILTPPDKTWRLEGVWHAPFHEETSLHAGTPHPSTHPSGD
jgi:hypothetical protein